METFRVGIVRDYLNLAGQFALEELGLRELTEAPGIAVDLFSEPLPEIAACHATCYDAIISPVPRYAGPAAEAARLSLVARLGVGYDGLDLQAFTAHDVMVTTTPDGIGTPMAGAVVTLLLALAHELLAKDRLVRAGRWQERTRIRTTGLRGRTFGAVGLGNIGREVLHVIQPFGMAHLAADPFVKPEAVAGRGVELVDLETLMRRSDFVSVHCPLNAQTRGMIGERELAWMKPTAYFINAARGPIVDQKALYRALQEGKIRGAGLDVFEQEPISPDDPLLGLDNVILTPHNLCWTDQCLQGMAKSAIGAVLTVLQGEVPPYLINREVLSSPRLRAKLQANRSRWQAAASAGTRSGAGRFSNPA